MLCNNNVRTGGFGPMANSHLTTCFVDVILLPLPTWLLLLFGLPFLVISSRHHIPSPRSCARLPFRILASIYTVLVVALLAMQVLEIVRLALSDSGVGLTPFEVVGTLVVFALLWARAKGRMGEKKVGGVLVVYWALLLAFQAAKVDTLVVVEKAAKAMGDKGPSKYPNSDKSLDNYVILGLYAVFFIYEGIRLLRKKQTTPLASESMGMNEPMMSKEGTRRTEA
ncbi:hypothetical protein BCR35DRAFT_350754 [Leucosporidium creatinivorum]|uniref:ABC transporter TMD0 domain-containing protein n=1 Tax=Leucosporidium creatinivorum TaxID=106004 RepID=A0A1Y2FXQ4_9BASI|nr:hypothetical protein BCR35DRAFT_350754 [Leucosporidium creatinivorum]